jgi:hydrogenase expression/formation protein HypE
MFAVTVLENWVVGMSLRSGKLPWNMMLKLLSIIPSKDIDLIMGPGIGEDAAIIRLRDGFLVIHSDPITAASKRIGWLAVHIVANDIAVRGARPRWFLPVVLIPESTNTRDVEEIFRDMSTALNELGGIAVGGHTEVTPGLNRPLISMTAAGYTSDRVVLTKDARPGDEIVVIGRIGGEGISVIAWDFEELLLEKGVDRRVVEKARSYLWDISVVEKALSVKEYVNSMHDLTEGGLLQGLREIALASGNAAIIDLDEVIVDEVVKEITGKLSIDPLRLLSSGSLVATVPPDRREEVEQVLEEKKYNYCFCGRIVESDHGRVFVRRGGKVIDIIDRDITDEIYKLWGKS